jgi:Double zinc ribbon
VDDSGRGALTAAGLPCGSCGTELPPNSKFCNECGAPVTQVSRSAEYKQVTVLFADVVRSMDIAATVGPERLREIMADLADRCAAVVERYGGTVDKPDDESEPVSNVFDCMRDIGTPHAGGWSRLPHSDRTVCAAHNLALDEH